MGSDNEDDPMSIVDSIKGALGMIPVAALPGLIDKAYPGGLNGLLGQLQQTGYGHQVESWLGRGPNQPITAQDLGKVLSNQQVQQMAHHFGIPADQILAKLSQVLPEAVDNNSPNGHLQTPPHA